jgi:ribosomal-protein-alanine N-acetyltransferase
MPGFLAKTLSAFRPWPMQTISQPVIRHIGIERAAECAALHALSFVHPWSLAELEQMLCAKETLADGAHDGKTHALYGFLLSRIAADEAEILTIAVDPGHRKNGIGAKLLTAHLARLAAKRVKTLFLEVDQNNTAARALYARFGFQKVGERKAYYRTADGNRATAIVMRLDIN